MRLIFSKRFESSSEHKRIVFASCEETGRRTRVRGAENGHFGGMELGPFVCVGKIEVARFKDIARNQASLGVSRFRMRHI